MEQSLVSIIVPVYNAESWIARCLDSLVNQSYRTIEIIVVSDGSTDKSEDLIRKHQEADHRIRLFCQPNQGVSAARNRGLALAQGEWVCFVDADDYVDRDYVQAMVDGLVSEEIDAVAVNFYMELPRGWRLPYPFVVLRRRLTGEQAVRQSFRVLFFPTFVWNKLFRRELFTRHGILFPSILYEDAFVVPLLFLHCRQVMVRKRPRYHYIRHSGSLTHQLASRHIRDYLKAADMLRQELILSGDWDRWKKPFARWLNRILTQIISTLYLAKRTMTWKERDRLIRRTHEAVKIIKSSPGTQIDLDKLILSE